MATPTETGIDLLAIHQRAGIATRSIVAGVKDDQGGAPTNCDMDVRALVNHIVSGHFWAGELSTGKTIAEVGARFDGDILDASPLDAYNAGLAEAQSAFARPGALEQLCHLSYGDLPGAVYCSHRILDTFIHGWDIARATRQNDTLDPELVEVVYAMFEPHAAYLQATGVFGTPVPISHDADTQTKLLAILGRDNRR